MIDQLKSVCPIFCQKEGKKTYLLGSGVLIEFRGHAFLLTAAHVMDELKMARLLVPNAEGKLKVIEEVHAYINPSEDRNKDFLDHGYFKLNENLLEGLRENFYFVKEHELGIEKYYADKQLFSFVGYPYRKSNVSGERASIETCAYGSGHAELSEYECLGYPVEACIVTKFNRNNSFNPNSGRIELPVLPHGISGGGVFIWPREIEITGIPPNNRKLVGIGHTWEKNEYLVGTRIEIYLESILRNNPSLR